MGAEREGDPLVGFLWASLSNPKSNPRETCFGFPGKPGVPHEDKPIWVWAFTGSVVFLLVSLQISATPKRLLSNSTHPYSLSISQRGACVSAQCAVECYPAVGLEDSAGKNSFGRRPARLALAQKYEERFGKNTGRIELDLWRLCFMRVPI